MKKNKLNRNTDGLKDFAKKKNQETIENVNKTIDKLKRSKTKKINFKTVAEESGVSKATLYNNDILKERIMSLRAIREDDSNGKITVVSKNKMQLKDDRIKGLYNKVEKLKEDKRKLEVQAVEMKELRDKNRKLRDQITRLNNENNRMKLVE